MQVVVVNAGTRLHVTYTVYRAQNPVSHGAIVVHHGICHTRAHFGRLIDALNRLGMHVVVIEQQSEHAFCRNFITLGSYVRGMAAAVRQIGKEIRVGTYALHSMGAMIGEEMQQRYPELQRPTVLMAPIPMDGAFPITRRILREDTYSYMLAVIKRDILTLAKTPEQVRRLFFDKDTPQADVDQARQQLKHAPFVVYCQLLLRFMRLCRIRDNKGPKLLLTSRTDGIFQPREYDKTRSRYQQLREDVIAGGHDFFIQYAEIAAQHIAAFHKQPIFFVHGPHASGRPHGEPRRAKPAPKRPFASLFINVLRHLLRLALPRG